MTARTVSFGTRGTLGVRYGQLVWHGENNAAVSIPIEDLGVVILESAQITITTAALQTLARFNVAVVLCDEHHLPLAQGLPYTSHSTAPETIAAQVAASDAVNGRIWRQLVRSKIGNQAGLLKRMGKESESRRLHNLAAEVRNGDPSNCEAQAARIYFQTLRPAEGFLREPDGDWPNAALNYGYAILRAAVARALVGSGLVCYHGVHHHNRYDAYCLADDVMEPYRPFVDQYILGGVPPFDEPAKELQRQHRRKLLEVLTCDVRMGDLKRPLAVAVTMTTASLAKHLLRKANCLALPELCP